MPWKLNIAMSRRVGERNYGSRGATVGQEMEVDSSLVDQPPELHRRIARLFRLATLLASKSAGRSVPGASPAESTNSSLSLITVKTATSAALPTAQHAADGQMKTVRP